MWNKALEEEEARLTKDKSSKDKGKGKADESDDSEIVS